MEIEVGEYIRTNSGLIDRITKNITDDDKFPYDAFDYMGEIVAYASCEIVSHSKNIIDLIQEGDYVNGYKVYKITEIQLADGSFEKVIKTLADNYFEDDIKSIVTKEQFSSVEYLLEEE